LNENSLLCRLISSCPDWQRVVASKHINYKSEGPYTIFNYDTLNCDFFDSVVQEARGIIIDIPRLEVVCWPFRKFGNYHKHVGAYKSLFVKDLPKQEDRLYRALLIELHMRPISYEQNSALQTKDRQLYGDKIIDEILILHDADIHGRKELQ